MAFSIVPCEPESLEIVRGLMLHPSLSGEFGSLAIPGAFEDYWNDPFVDPSLRWLALVDGTPVGFCLTSLLPSTTGIWVMLRLGVLEPHRAAGLGTALLQTCLERLEEPDRVPGLEEVCIAAWLPAVGAPAFAALHGFEHARYFWKMTRPHGAPESPDWPAGIEVRTFDQSEGALRDWNQAYLASFAEHYHFVATSLEDRRALTRLRTFRPEGLVLAYRDERCVGFSHNSLRGREGEVAVIGVVPGARGLGLGRALLRWSVAWLESIDADPVALAVDGENEGALALYRSEGFQVARTREIWARAASSSSRVGSRSPRSARSSRSSSP